MSKTSVSGEKENWGLEIPQEPQRNGWTIIGTGDVYSLETFKRKYGSYLQVYEEMTYERERRPVQYGFQGVSL